MDLAIRLDLSLAGDDGELVHTLHEAELVEQVKGLLEGGRCRTIERLWALVSDAVLSFAAVRRLRARLPKVAPPIPGFEGRVAVERAAIAPGSDLGDRRATLDAAVAMLRTSPGIRLLARLAWPWRAPARFSQRLFCAMRETNRRAEALLDRLLVIERQFGRVSGERWGLRTLDLDVIVFGQLQLQLRSTRLEIPHPRLRERALGRMPLAEIAPDWINSVTGHGVARLAGALLRAG